MFDGRAVPGAYQSVSAGLAFLKGESGFHTEFAQWDGSPYLLNCADGMVDLRTGAFTAHDPKLMCTRLCRWEYSNENTTGAWQRHLERCLPEPDVRRQVQRDLGRALVDAVLEESLPICLYFKSVGDREGFIRLMREVKPDMTVKRMP